MLPYIAYMDPMGIYIICIYIYGFPKMAHQMLGIPTTNPHEEMGMTVCQPN